MKKASELTKLLHVQIKVCDDILPFQAAHQKQIDENWLCECALKPSLFNGSFFFG